LYLASSNFLYAKLLFNLSTAISVSSLLLYAYYSAVCLVDMTRDGSGSLPEILSWRLRDTARKATPTRMINARWI
jgi:hypothetical protein